MNLNQREFDSAFITPPPKIYDATIFSSAYLNRQPTRKIQSRISQNPSSIQIPSTFSLPNASSSISNNKRSFPSDSNGQVETTIKRQNISTYVSNDYRRYNYQHYQEIPHSPPSMTVDEFDRLVFPSSTGVPIHEDLNDILNKPIPVDDDEIGHLSFSDLSESILPEDVPKPPVSPPLPSRSAPTTPIHSRTSSSHYLPSSSHYTPSSSHYSPPPSSSHYTPSSIPPSSPYKQPPSSLPPSSIHPSPFPPSSSIPPPPSISSQSQALSYKQQGNQAFEHDAYEEACSYYTLSLVFEPNDPVVFSNRAACHMSLHRPKKALKDALMSIQLNPQFIRGYCRAGKAYLIQGELTEAKNMYSQAIILLNQQQQQGHKIDINRYHECKTCLQVIKEVHTQVQSLPIVYTSLQHVKATVQLLLTIKKTCYAWRSLYLQLLHCYLLLYDFNSTSILLSHITPSLLPSLTQYQNSLPFTDYPFTIAAWDAAAIDIFNEDVSGVDIEIVAYWCYYFIMKQQLMECIQLLNMVREEPRFKDHKTAQRFLVPLAFINQLNKDIEESKQQYKKKDYNQCLLLLSSCIDQIHSYYHQYGKKEYPISIQDHKRFSSCLENIVFDNCLCSCFELQIRCLYHCEQYQSVIDECEKLLQYQEDNCTAIKKRGQAYCLLHLFDQGLTDIRLYLSYKPNDKKVLSYYSFIQNKIEQEKKRKLSSETPFNSYQYYHNSPKQSTFSSPFKSKSDYSFPSKFEATFHPSEPASEGYTSDEPTGPERPERPGSNYSSSSYQRSYTGSSSHSNRRFIHYPSRDYYSLLGVSKNASEKEIRQSYLKLARQYHPDKNPSEKAQALFVRIKEAYDVLSDPVKRKKYDVSY